MNKQTKIFLAVWFGLNICAYLVYPPLTVLSNGLGFILGFTILRSRDHD